MQCKGKALTLQANSTKKLCLITAMYGAHIHGSVLEQRLASCRKLRRKINKVNIVDRRDGIELERQGYRLMIDADEFNEVISLESTRVNWCGVVGF